MTRLRLLVLVSALAGVLAGQDFEDRLPGEIPAGWSVAWGRPQCDTWGTTNHLPYAGSRCLFLDRPVDSSDGQYGVARHLESITGLARLSFLLRLDGPGSLACPSIELREQDGQRILTTITFSQHERQVRVGHGVIGVTSDATWHRLVLDWPAVGGNGTAAIDPASGPAAEALRIELPPRPGGVVFMICVHVKGFTVRLDELHWNCRGD